MRTGHGRSWRAAAVVLFVGGGLFAMHLLVLPGAMSGVMSTAHAASEGHDTSSHAMTTAVQSGSLAGGVLTRAEAWTAAHEHEMLGCLWTIATAVGLAVVVLMTRLRDGTAGPASCGWWLVASSQRAPPVGARLALVGVSRR